LGQPLPLAWTIYDDIADGRDQWFCIVAVLASAWRRL